MNQQVLKAEALFQEGYNCAQAVFVAFHDSLGMEKDTALRLMSSFGGGMGRLREVCGALTAVFAAAGILYGYSNPDDQDQKAAHYAFIQELAERFRNETGSILCRDLLQLTEKSSDPTPELRTPEYYEKRPCAAYVRLGASLLEELVSAKVKT